MRYRADWRLLLRASRLEGAQRLLNRLREAWPEEFQDVSLEPWREQRQSWDCYFSTPDWDTSYAEAVVRCMRQAQAIASGWRWGHLNEKEGTFEGTFRAHPNMGGTRYAGLSWALVQLQPADTLPSAAMPTRDLTVPAQTRYTVWLEAEQRAPGTWSPRDDNSDVIVTFENGIRWSATFYSYENIATLRAKNQGTGECLGGRYFWGSDMILIEEISRPSIEAVIAGMLQDGTFERAFQYLGKAEALED